MFLITMSKIKSLLNKERFSLHLNSATIYFIFLCNLKINFTFKFWNLFSDIVKLNTKLLNKKNNAKRKYYSIRN